MYLKYFLAWVSIMIIAFANAAIRQAATAWAWMLVKEVPPSATPRQPR